jgi:predicted chitinase
MSLWQDFLDDVFGDENKPGKVMICFVNRQLEGMDGVQYKIKYDGMERSGTTTEQAYCVELQPKSFAPIQTYVWSRKALAFKKLDDVVAESRKKKLVRKALKTFKTSGHPDQLPKNPPNNPPPTKPAPAPAPGPSPKDNQGHNPQSTKNENNQPLSKPERPVPNGITKEQLKKIFPAAKEDYLQSIADECNKDLVKYHLDTLYRRAHFFAQIKAESGSSMKPVSESWEYSPEFLRSNFSYYKNNPDEAKEDGYKRGKPHKDKHGKTHKGKIIRHANQEAIGKKHFAKLNGNRTDHTEDGYNFRGRGLIQITGYEKYSGFKNDYSKYFDGTEPDSVNNPDIINQAPYSIRSAIWFWVWRKGFSIADKNNGLEDVKKVSLVVNGGYIGIKERESAYLLAEAAFK